MLCDVSLGVYWIAESDTMHSQSVSSQDGELVLFPVERYGSTQDVWRSSPAVCTVGSHLHRVNTYHILSICREKLYSLMYIIILSWQIPPIIIAAGNSPVEMYQMLQAKCTPPPPPPPAPSPELLHARIPELLHHPGSVSKI